MNITSKDRCLQHYHWGTKCDGWVLADTKELSVKQERMPPQAAESMHYHEKAQQFFFILKGKATFELENSLYTLGVGEGIQIQPLQKHRVLNNTPEDLEFLLCSQPSTQNDRINCI